MKADSTTLPLVGISACLVGERVRYNGAHKYAPHVIDALSNDVRWENICPEVAAGLPVPRPAMWLRPAGDELRLWSHDGAIDHTQSLIDAAERTIHDLLARGMAGFVAKARSPSCGVGDTPIMDCTEPTRPEVIGHTSGLFVQTLQRLSPEIPIASDEALQDPIQRIQFLEQVRRLFESKA